MFDKFKNMAGLMKDLPRIKTRMEEVKTRLGEQRVEAETGGGAVRVSANGLLRVVDIEVDQALIAGLVEIGNPDDKAMAEDLIAGAVNEALEKARQMVEEEFANAASELDLPLPPGALGGLLGAG